MSSYRITVRDRGRLVLPAALRRACGMREGQEVIVTLKDDGVLMLQPADVLERKLQEAQAALSDRNGVQDLREWREETESRRADHLEHPTFDPSLSAERGRQALERLGLA